MFKPPISISIHAPLAGSDLFKGQAYSRSWISIHAPLAGSDHPLTSYAVWSVSFQSTLPLRGATRESPCVDTHTVYFNPRSPCGERHDTSLRTAGARISIHAPLAGSDGSCGSALEVDLDFNPRSPCGERLGDCAIGLSPRHFNPRSPCGERRTAKNAYKWLDEFQSTLPLRGATDTRHHHPSKTGISIHAPLAGSDNTRPIFNDNIAQFQSTLPLRGATAHPLSRRGRSGISIHAPLAGSDCIGFAPELKSRIFQSTLPLRGATFHFG